MGDSLQVLIDGGLLVTDGSRVKERRSDKHYGKLRRIPWAKPSPGRAAMRSASTNSARAAASAAGSSGAAAHTIDGASPPLGAGDCTPGSEAHRVTLDGATVNLRHEGRKEFKIACVFGLGVRRCADSLAGEEAPLAQTVDTSCVAHLGGPDAIGEFLVGEAQRRKLEQAGEKLVLGDGVLWIWKQATLHFPDSQALVDWYHARSHLVDTAKQLKGEDTPAGDRWLEERNLTLYQGHAATIARELAEAVASKPLNAADLARPAVYFAGTAKRMS